MELPKKFIAPETILVKRSVVCSRNGICGLDLVVEEVIVVKAPEPPNITLLDRKEWKLINTKCTKFAVL